MMHTMGGVQQSLSSLSGAMTSAYAQAGAQAEAALAAFEKEYCKPATFTPSEDAGGRQGDGWQWCLARGARRMLQCAPMACRLHRLPNTPRPSPPSALLPCRPEGSRLLCGPLHGGDLLHGQLHLQREQVAERRHQGGGRGQRGTAAPAAWHGWRRLQLATAHLAAGLHASPPGPSAPFAGLPSLNTSPPSHPTFLPCAGAGVH